MSVELAFVVAALLAAASIVSIWLVAWLETPPVVPQEPDRSRGTQPLDAYARKG